MEMIDYKAEKLLRIECELDEGRVKYIKIAGDFFIHPEEKIIEIEQFLKGLSISGLAEKLRGFLTTNSIRVIGFTPEDIERALRLSNP